MEKFELEPKLAEEIRQRVFGEGFMKLVQSVRRGGKTFKISLRPVDIGGERKMQAEMVDDGQVQVKNLKTDAAVSGLEEIIAQKGARDLHLMTATGDLHVRVTKKGHVLVSRSGTLERVVTVKPHDRVKNVPLNQFDATALLKVIGLADGDGKIRASMRGKYDQVNEFLKVVGETVEDGTDGASGAPEPLPKESNRPFTVVDCGCGKAYLTISLWFYLVYVKKYPSVKVIGIDRRADVIESARKMAEQLDLAEKVVFVEADLGNDDAIGTIASTGGSGTKVDMVVSLHACDTATDEALARGVEWKAKYILSAPCCQHELQKAIGTSANGTFAGLLRQGILRERLCDLLTDAFRAMILRILGFKVQVIEFVSPEATARNIMLKCEYGVKPGQPGPVGEYLEFRDYWHVEPWLAGRLKERLEPFLARFV